MMSTTSGAINADQAKTIARRACDEEDVQLLDYRLEAYSKSKVGFLGNHQKLEMSVRRKARGSGEKTEKLSFFVKTLPRDSAEQLEFVKQRRVFNQEAEFFTKLMPCLLEASGGGDDIEAWAPKCYLATDELLVLEDARERGFAMRESKILTCEEVALAAQAMARMHAASIVAESRLSRAPNELYPEACAEQIFHSRTRDHGFPLSESLIRDVAERENRPCSVDVLSMIHRAFDFVTSDDAEHRVVCHGDAWPNNVMINDQPQVPAAAKQCLLVDYQMTRYAPRMFDVAQLVCLSTRREARDKDEKSLVVRAYWEELCATLGKCEPSIEKPTYDQLIEEYDEAKHAALFLAVMYLPTIALGKDVFAEYKDDPAMLYRKFVFRRDNQCIYQLMDEDEEYARRITEVVLNFIESCEKIRPADE